MKETDWKGIAELVGIAAIVASLIFVGVQLRQDRQIARAEALADMLDNGLDSRANINQFAHVLAKGNSGAELSAAEVMIIRNIVRDERDRVFLQTFREEVLGGAESRTPELMFAVFLHQNPAAREAWEHHTVEMESLIDPLRTRESMTKTRQSGSAVFRARISDYLARLDELDP